MSRILIVDDDPPMLAALAALIKARGDVSVSARSGREALSLLDGVELVITDYMMPEMDGVALLAAIRERDEQLPVVLVTAHGSDKIAVRAMKLGAYEYVTKPFDVDELGLVIDRALEARALRTQNQLLVAEKILGRGIVGSSAPMMQLLDLVRRVAPRDITVLIRGETGTGKELIASLLHSSSRRSKKPLVRFNCAAIPGELAEAELFGHARGAFTGADKSRRGYFAEADGGTLVLDEVGELPISVQAKLLRALQEGEIQPVGAARVEKVDVRVIASTHRDLHADIAAGHFREDLYYRLAVVELVVPPLREHREDIAGLAVEFARRYAARFGAASVSLAPALLTELESHAWPGNVRQLENTIARMVALSDGGELGVEQWHKWNLGAATPEAAAEAQAPEELEDLPREPALGRPPGFREQVDAFERNLIAQTLELTRGNQSEAARRLGLARGTFIERMKKHNLGSDR